MTTNRLLCGMHQAFAVALLGSMTVGTAPALVSAAYPVPQGEPRCNKCADGNCVPNRFTYGYYAPKWRRWPGAAVGPETIPTPPERRPAPADEESSSTPPRAPEKNAIEPDTSEEITRPDSSKSSTMPEPDGPSTRTPVPGTNKKELPAPNVDEGLLNEILEGDSSTPSTTSPSTDLPPFPGDETSPAVPDTGSPNTNDTTDPFGDDANQSSHRSPGMLKRASADLPASAGTLASRRKASKVRMRSAATSGANAERFEDSAVQAAVASEPAIGSGNPLRQQHASDAHRSVVPSADWSTNEGASAVTRAVWRTNPLR
jgi:hypothetical protein